eukprot:m.518441 g.518441  ORF g.518441 m.518441 type:complete len:62 (+) comp132582_c0_seq1:114-299(+)
MTHTGLCVRGYKGSNLRCFVPGGSGGVCLVVCSPLLCGQKAQAQAWLQPKLGAQGHTRMVL